MASPAYFNTTPITGTHLAAAIVQAEQQDQAVMRIMTDNVARSPSQVWQVGRDAGRQWLLTSVRRSMTNLEHAGALEKLDVQRPGPYGRPERVWRKA